MNGKCLASAVLLILLASTFLITIPIVSADILEVGPGKPYSTIQAAMDAANPGDTIIVAAETYTEQVRFTKRVTVTSSTGEAVSGGVVIDPNGTEFEGPVSGHMVRAAVTFEAGSSGSVLRGVIIENSYASDYMPGNQGGNSGIEVIDGGINNVVVQNVSVNNVAGHGFGSYDTNHPWPSPSGWLIDNCSFSTTDTDTWSGMRPENMDNLTIQDCDIGPTNYGGILLINVNNTVVQRNKVHNTVRAGIQVDSYCTDAVDILNNEVWATNSANKTDYGDVRLYGQQVPDPHGGAPATVTIQGNLLHDGYNGICVKTGQNISTRTVMVRENNILGHSNYGALNAGTGTLDATSNWWGDASGPTHSSNVGGIGDAISDYVDYSPWLGATFETTPRTFHVNPTGTIQEAIDAANSGDTIIVAAGTYAGAIVDKDVTISGTSGGASIIGSGVPYKTGSSLYTAFRLDDTADGVEIRDFEINCNSSEGFYFAIFSRNVDNAIIDSLTANDAVQGISNWGGSNWEITNNILYDTEAAGGGGIAIFLGAYPPGYVECCGNLIQGNTITAMATAEDYTCPGICLSLDLRWGAYDDLTGDEDVSGNQIIDNNITAPGALNGVGIETGVIGLEGNTTKIAAVLGIVHGNTIEGNTIDGADMGVYFYTVTDLTVQQNEITNCNEGIHVEGGTSGNIINYNNIFGNGMGMNSTSEKTVDARFNWWGDSSGPSGVGPGTGDAVSGNVSFNPWLSCYQPQTETQIYINPAVVEKYALAGIEGSTFEVQVKVKNIIDLYGFEFNVTWNSNLTKLVGVEYTSQLNQIWSQWTAQKNKTGPSWYQLVALALAPAVGFNGEGTLAKLTFRVEYGPCYIEPDYQLQARIHFAVVKLSDSDAQHICAEVHDGKYIIYAFKPALKLRPTAVTCRKLGETFTTEIKMIDGFKVSGFDIEIKYNTTLLEVDNIQWGNLSYFLPGPYIVKQFVRDDLNGLIHFHLVENVSDGAPLAYGDGILAAITFNVIKTKVWKNCLGWTNSIQDSITFKDWNITVMCPETYHLTGELVYTIDADYQFLSIKGDIDSDGIVDIFDITAVAAYYGIIKGNPDYISDFDLNCDNIIDIFDLVLIGGNFGYEYDP